MLENSTPQRIQCDSLSGSHSCLKAHTNTPILAGLVLESAIVSADSNADLRANSY